MPQCSFTATKLWPYLLSAPEFLTECEMVQLWFVIDASPYLLKTNNINFICCCCCINHAWAASCSTSEGKRSHLNPISSVLPSQIAEPRGRFCSCVIQRRCGGHLSPPSVTPTFSEFLLSLLQEDMQQLILMPLPNVAILGQDPLTGTRSHQAPISAGPQQCSNYIRPYLGYQCNALSR